MKLQDYKGYEIHVDDKTGLFEVRTILTYPGTGLADSWRVEFKEKPTLKAAQEAVDGRIKREGKSLKVLLYKGSRIVEGTATSITNDERYARVTQPAHYNPKQKITEQEAIWNTYKDTPENHAILQQVIILDGQLTEIKFKRDNLIKTVSRITAEDIMGAPE